MAKQQPRIVLLFVFLLPVLSVFAQQKTTYYNVINKNDVIGTMTLSQNTTNDALALKLLSDVQTKGFMSVNVKVEEESHFEKGRLVTSSVKRYMNGTEKTARTTTATAGGYVASGDSGTHLVTKQPILYNVGMLYIKEPTGIKQLYSDNFQAFIPVEELEPHIYKITLPDNNYNVYHYTNGICTKADIHNGFYNMQMVLK